MNRVMLLGVAGFGAFASQAAHATPLGPVPYDAVASELRSNGLGPTSQFRMSSRADCKPSSGKLVGLCSIRFSDGARTGRGAVLGYMFFRAGYNFAEISRMLGMGLTKSKNAQEVIVYHPTMTLTVNGRPDKVQADCYQAWGAYNSMMSCALAVSANVVMTADVNPARNSSTRASYVHDTRIDMEHAGELLGLGTSVFAALSRRDPKQTRPTSEGQVHDPNSNWKEPRPVDSAARTGRGAIGDSATFDLLCSGTSTSNGKTEPAHATIHVDLRAMKYCFDKCTTTMPIASVTSASIVLKHSNKDGNINEASVDRHTGAWMDFTDANIGFHFVSRETGICRATPFTGFARRKS